MIKFYTSYFYNIRFFTPNMIPMSTAIWDPKWYHDFKGSNYIWKDANGVYNGIRAEELNPKECHADGCPCQYQGIGYSGKCAFLKSYKAGLNRINFNKFIEKCSKFAEFLADRDGFSDPIIVFIFHESPDNPCSERASVHEWFRDNGIELKEWIK